MPWTELEGAANVRDLGGLVTRDGGEIVAGRPLRGVAGPHPERGPAGPVTGG